MRQAVTPTGDSGRRGSGPSLRLPAATSLLVELLLVVGLNLHAQGTSTGAGPVYSLAQIDVHLAQQPDRWVGRTLRLWALAQPCPTWGSPHSSLHCASWQPVLVDPDDSALDPPLPLAAGSGDHLLGLLRGLPVVRGLLPVQRLVWERPEIYRVRLRATRAGSCWPPPCYEAVLQDSAL